MSTHTVLRAWRDHHHWMSLSDVQRSKTPENPAGTIELMDEQLEQIVGGYRSFGPASIPETYGACDCQCTRCGGNSCYLTWYTGRICCT
jgi:mersacidin/lichenicidin family type 2 lantibiotic